MSNNVYEKDISEDRIPEELETKNSEQQEEPKYILDKIFKFVKDSPPLFLPVGSIRSILALGLIAISGFMVSKGMDMPEWLYSSIIMVLGFYFGARNGKTK